MRSWSLSDELHQTFHQWPKISLFFLIGCLIGWVVSLILPVNYRASATIYVALNPYRTYEDSNFLANVKPEYSNLDDYKNWQMGQLNTAIFLDEIIQETLNRLKEQDQTWMSVDVNQLRDQLLAEWRSAGKWSLVAENRDAGLALHAAETWGETVYERVGIAVDAARDLITTDYKIEAVVQEYNEVQSRLQQFKLARDRLESWIAATQDLPVEGQIEFAERSQVLGLVTDLAQSEPSWMDVLNNQPEAASSRSDFIEWTREVLSKIEGEISDTQASVKYLEDEQTDLQQQYAEQFSLSLGLSPNLEVESIEIVPAERVQPTGIMTLAGGICGLLLWLFKELVRITNQVKRNE
jgi:hypothetical protein